MGRPSRRFPARRAVAAVRPAGVGAIATRSGRHRLRRRHPVRRRPARRRGRRRAAGAGRGGALADEVLAGVFTVTSPSRSSGRRRSAASWRPDGLTAPTSSDGGRRARPAGTAAQLRRAASMLTAGEDLGGEGPPVAQGRTALSGSVGNVLLRRGGGVTLWGRRVAVAPGPKSSRYQRPRCRQALPARRAVFALYAPRWGAVPVTASFPRRLSRRLSPPPSFSRQRAAWSCSAA